MYLVHRAPSLGTTTDFQPRPKFFIRMDSIVRTIIAKFQIRSEIGKKKYGTTLDRTDLSVIDWINHAQEEHMDAILYLEKLKQTLVGVTLEKK